MCDNRNCLGITFESCNCCNESWCEKHLIEHLAKQARN